MSKNTLLSNLINYISSNSSGNVVIAAPSSGLALDVTGTGRFTGSLGVGIVPSAWGTLVKGFQVGLGASFSGNTSSPDAYMTSNCYHDGSNWRYINTNTALSYDARAEGGNFIWQTAPSGTAGNIVSFTERMRITTAGNVGIGTASIVNGSSFGGGGQVNRLKVESSSYTCLEINGSTSGGSIQFTYGTNLPNQVAALIAYNYGSGTVNELFIANALNGATVFSTNNIERMRLISGGTLMIGAASGLPSVNYKLYTTGLGGIWADASNSGDAAYVARGTTGFYYYGMDNSSANKFYVAQSGQIGSTSTSIAAISDIRHKENIRDLETGLSDVLLLKPSRFDWKEGKGTGRKNVAGFIAQDIEDVLPDLVDEWKENMNATESFKSIRMGDLIPTLVKAIQELKSEIDLLKQQ